MIEVNGYMDKDCNEPLYMSFDGKIFEIIYRGGMHTDLARYPLGWLKKLEIEEMGDKGRTLKYSMKFSGPVGFFTFASGAENLDELVNEINAAINAF